MSTTMTTTRIDKHAAVREFYDRNGYYVFRNALSRDAIKAVHDCLERDVYPNTAPLLRHPAIAEGDARLSPGARWEQVRRQRLVQSASRSGNGAAPKPSSISCAATKPGFFLEAIDGEPQHTMHQAILFFVSPGTDAHIDGWALDTVPPGNFATMWVPLERFRCATGRSACFHGSEASCSRPKCWTSTWRGRTTARHISPTRMRLSVRSIKERGISCVVPQLEPGDLIVFSSLTPACRCRP